MISVRRFHAKESVVDSSPQYHQITVTGTKRNMNAVRDVSCVLLEQNSWVYIFRSVFWPNRACSAAAHFWAFPELLRTGLHNRFITLHQTEKQAIRLYTPTGNRSATQQSLLDQQGPASIQQGSESGVCL
eukprot:3611129-Amphidinium_carterae.1